jgi:hypothetical protein
MTSQAIEMAISMADFEAESSMVASPEWFEGGDFCYL